LLWRTFPEDRITLSEGGAVATQASGGDSLTTTEIELTEGKHYWEVELLSKNVANIFIGISRPNLDPTGDYGESGDGWFINPDDGGLWGNGKWNDDEAGEYKQGDRVGVLLDFDNGSLLLLQERRTAWAWLPSRQRYGTSGARSADVH
jgi:hypothetical protein